MLAHPCVAGVTREFNINLLCKGLLPVSWLVPLFCPRLLSHTQSGKDIGSGVSGMQYFHWSSDISSVLAELGSDVPLLFRLLLRGDEYTFPAKSFNGVRKDQPTGGGSGVDMLRFNVHPLSSVFARLLKRVAGEASMREARSKPVCSSGEVRREPLAKRGSRPSPGLVALPSWTSCGCGIA